MLSVCINDYAWCVNEPTKIRVNLSTVAQPLLAELTPVFFFINAFAGFRGINKCFSNVIYYSNASAASKCSHYDVVMATAPSSS